MFCSEVYFLELHYCYLFLYKRLCMAMVNRPNKMCQVRDGKVNLNTVSFFLSFFFFLLVQHGRTPLHDAAEKGHSEVVTKLLESGADVDVKAWVRKAFVMEWNIYPAFAQNQSHFEFLFSWLIYAVYCFCYYLWSLFMFLLFSLRFLRQLCKIA